MPPHNSHEELHGHATWGPHLRAEYAADGKLHRHRIADRHASPRFTSWAHNTPAHSHRLPDGAWTRPRVDLRPAEDPAFFERGFGRKRPRPEPAPVVAPPEPAAAPDQGAA
jgi:hypothetical protein